MAAMRGDPGVGALSGELPPWLLPSSGAVAPLPLLPLLLLLLAFSAVARLWSEESVGGGVAGCSSAGHLAVVSGGVAVAAAPTTLRRGLCSA